MKIDIKKALFLKKKHYIEITPTIGKYCDILDFAANLIKNDCDIFQINQGIFSDKDYLKLAKDLRQITSIYDTLLVIKNRADIAKLSKADGIFLDYNSLTITDCKKLLDENILIGTNAEKNTDEYDFCLIDNDSKELKIPAFQKTKTKGNIIYYEAIKYGNN